MITMSNAMLCSPLIAAAAARDPTAQIIGGAARATRSWWRKWLRAALALCVVANVLCMTGCSAVRAVYNQAPALSYWWLDGYLDFNGAQSLRARDVLHDWFAWHRRSELPQYAALLARARGEVVAPAPATAAQACGWFDLVNQRFDAAFERALPGLADVLRRLSPEQIEHLKQKYADSNNELADSYLQRQPEARTKANLNRALDRFELVYGSLDNAQRERIALLALKTPFDAERWLAERRARQLDVLQTLTRLNAEQASVDVAAVALRGLVQRSRSSPRDDYRAYQQRLVQFNCGFAAEVHNLTNSEQRSHAAGKLKSWEDDLRALAAQEDR
jgi:hypothetical protein